MLLKPSAGEQAYGSLHDSLQAGHVVGAQAFARVDTLLAQVERQQIRRRKLQCNLLLFTAWGDALVGVLGFVDPSSRGRSVLGAPAAELVLAATLAAAGLALRFTKTGTERLIRLYRKDPSLQPQVLVTPSVNGGATLSLTRRF